MLVLCILLIKIPFLGGKLLDKTKIWLFVTLLIFTTFVTSMECWAKAIIPGVYLSFGCFISYKVCEGVTFRIFNMFMGINFLKLMLIFFMSSLHTTFICLQKFGIRLRIKVITASINTISSISNSLKYLVRMTRNYFQQPNVRNQEIVEVVDSSNETLRNNEHNANRTLNQTVSKISNAHGSNTQTSCQIAKDSSVVSEEILDTIQQQNLRLKENLECLTQKLEEAEERSNEARTCTICLDKERSHIFLPCGHLVCCAKCAKQAKNEPPNQCPMCRKPIKNTVKAYMS